MNAVNPHQQIQRRYSRTCESYTFNNYIGGNILKIYQRPDARDS